MSVGNINDGDQSFCCAAFFTRLQIYSLDTRTLCSSAFKLTAIISRNPVLLRSLQLGEEAGDCDVVLRVEAFLCSVRKLETNDQIHSLRLFSSILHIM
jgi:hypothetical protein